jgi:LPXTG-motif cell wall-anchored protein
MKRLAFLFVAVLALGGAGTAFAVNTSSDTYLPSNQPLIKGTVTEVGEHSVTVDTFNGERMTFTVDSRTVMPTTMQAGTRVKIEFHAMEDGRYHAARVTPFQPTTDEIASIKPVAVETETSEPTSYDRTTYDRTTYDRTADDRAAADRTSVSRDENRSSTNEESALMDRDRAGTNGDAEPLPATASNVNLFGLLGLAAFASAASLWLLRRRSSRS